MFYRKGYVIARVVEWVDTRLPSLSDKKVYSEINGILGDRANLNLSWLRRCLLLQFAVFYLFPVYI